MPFWLGRLTVAAAFARTRPPLIVTLKVSVSHVGPSLTDPSHCGALPGSRPRGRATGTGPVPAGLNLRDPVPTRIRSSALQELRGAAQAGLLG